MYTDDDLTNAVGQGIFHEDSVQQFRHYIARAKNTNLVDEENFRLISGFNDVFVVIASGLLLVSVAWLGAMFVPWLGALLCSITSWGLAEYFVRQRRMALPAIGLLLSFLGGIFALPILFYEFNHQQIAESTIVISGILTAVAARLHWLRFKVPVTVAVGTAAAVVCALATIVTIFPMTLTTINFHWGYRDIFCGDDVGQCRPQTSNAPFRRGVLVASCGSADDCPSDFYRLRYFRGHRKCG